MKRDLEKFKKIFIAFYTAYDEEGNVSPERTKDFVNYLYDKGIRGLYITGSSGECVYLTTEERKIIMKAVMEEAKGRMTVIAHVAAPSTKDSVILAGYAKELGCDGISAIPPIYYGLSEDAIVDYWTAITEAAELPFFLYNIPANTGVNISKGLFKRMLKNKWTCGIKNTSLPVMDIQQFKEIGGSNCIVFNGPDEQLAAGRLMGADAGIGGTYGVMPELFLKIDEFVRKGDFKNASLLQRETTSLILELLSIGSMFAVNKEILRLRGLDLGLPRRPLPSLDDKQKDKVKVFEKKIDKVIAKWC